VRAITSGRGISLIGDEVVGPGEGGGGMAEFLVRVSTHAESTLPEARSFHHHTIAKN
jgi:hypothetical protein